MKNCAGIQITIWVCALTLGVGSAGVGLASPHKARRVRRVRTAKGRRLLSIDGMVVLGRRTLAVKSGTSLSAVATLGVQVKNVSPLKHGYVKVTFEPNSSGSLLARVGRIVERANGPKTSRTSKTKRAANKTKPHSTANPYAPVLLDRKAKSEIDGLALGKRKAFVYGDRQDTIAVGHGIHAMLAMELAPNMQKGVAGFIERTTDNHIKIIHWPQSPVDFSSPELLRAVQAKLTKLGYSVSLERRPRRR